MEALASAVVAVHELGLPLRARDDACWLIAAWACVPFDPTGRVVGMLRQDLDREQAEDPLARRAGMAALASHGLVSLVRARERSAPALRPLARATLAHLKNNPWLQA
mmetsp:Transcript_5642/g.16785  ORF Transcript_5642/g.16785 Transcript_5642/m.16785 type:complete len:107 (-) Transcript_5642:115-435(-)